MYSMLTTNRQLQNASPLFININLVMSIEQIQFYRWKQTEFGRSNKLSNP